ncbi:MAG: carbon-nitrogen hydrolase family protein [Acidiferrobacterales bacterium]
MNIAAAIQMASGPNLGANLTEASRLIASAASLGAGLVVLPENFALMPMRESDRLEAAETFGDGLLQEFLAARAREYGLWIVGGTIPVVTDSKEKFSPACLVFDDKGENVARYDKMHLFDVKLENGEEYNESVSQEPGDQTVVIDTPFGKMGLAVCYDLRFPELFRRMLDEGAEIFAIPSAFTEITGKAHWEVLVRARAIENLAYVIAADQGGYHVNGRETHGDSMIVGPWGLIHDRLARGSGIVTAELDLKRMVSIRNSLPSIHHRRIRFERSA